MICPAAWILKLNPEKLALLQKILAKSTLEPQDYQKIVSFLHPADLRTIQGDANKLFEASESGLLIAAMSPEQRLELVKAFYQLKPAAEAQDFVDALIYAKVLTLQQAETLSNQEGVKPAEQQRLKQALENGNFSAGIREYEKLLASTAHANEGRGAGSIFSDNTTMAALGMIGLGGLTAILNAMVVFDPAHPVESLKKFMQTGYGPMGAATATIGTLMLAGTPEFAQRGWEAAKRFFTGSDLLPKIREEARGEIELLLINTIDSNPFLIRTLLADSQENHQTVFQIFQSKIDAVNNHQLQDFTLEDIYKDLSEDQKAKFQILANNCEGNTDEEKRQTAFIFVKKFMEGCDGLGIKTTKQLLDLQAAIEEDKRKQAAGSTAPKATEQPEKPATN